MSDTDLYSLASGAQDTWSWSHLKTFVGQDEAVKHLYAGEFMQMCLQYISVLWSSRQDVCLNQFGVHVNGK